jgi:hypothetical protein
MVSSTQHTIIIERAGKADVIQRENIGTKSIMPGQVLEFESNGYVQKHSEADAPAFFVALETETPDTSQYPQTPSIDIPYADGETVYMAQFRPGDVVNMWLADGNNVTKGRHLLGSDGSGRLASLGTGNVAIGTANPIGVAWEDNNNSSGTAVRCKVLII